MKGISDEKLKSLLDEGFSEGYIREILKNKPSPLNPEIDLNAPIREALGIPHDHKASSAGVTMTNHRISVVAKRPRINPYGD